MDDADRLSDSFEAHRNHLHSVAYRMLGSLSEADDAVQETWLRLARSDTTEVQNLRAWLTTVVARVCLDMLRARTARREQSFDVHVPDPIISSVHGDPAPDDDPSRSRAHRTASTSAVHSAASTKRPAQIRV